MASSQGTQLSKVSKREATLAFIEAYGSFPELWGTETRHYIITADVAIKQQTTALFLSTIVTRTRRHTELTKKKIENLMGNLCCAREHSVQFSMQYFTQLTLIVLIWRIG